MKSVPVNCKADRLSAFFTSRAEMSAIRTRHEKQPYLSRKATMGIFGLYERSHIKRYWINQMLYWLHVCICLRLLVWNAGRSHVKKIPPAKKSGGGGGQAPSLPLPVCRLWFVKVFRNRWNRQDRKPSTSQQFFSFYFLFSIRTLSRR